MIFFKKYRTEVRCKVRLLFCSLLIIVLSENLFAQREYDNDITMGYGLITSNQIFDVTTDVLTSAILPGVYSTSNTQFSGGFSVNYKNSISERWNVGLTFSLDYITKDVFIRREKKGDLNRNYITMAGEIDYRYFKRELFQMYSLIGLGYTMLNDRYMPIIENEISKDTFGFMNFQISLLGLRIGKELAFYTEFGFGYKGILNFGFSYQF